MQTAYRVVTLAAALFAFSLLASCVSVTPQTTGAGSRAEEAVQAERNGRYDEAARLWESAAAAATPRRQSPLWLRAAEAWAADGRMEESRTALARVDENDLEAPGAARYALLQAEQALLRGDSDAAAFYLEIARPGLSESQFERYLSIEESVTRMRTNPASHVLSMIEREASGVSAQEPRQVADLLAALERVRSGSLALAAMSAPEHPASGWAALALMMRQALVTGQNPYTAAQAWSEGRPGHAVGAAAFAGAMREYASRYPMPSSVGVLLPATGALAPAAAAIRDGLMSAYFERPGTSQLRFYATGDGAEGALAAHAKALDDRVDWIVGPLDRDSTDAVARFAPALVPILLLNEHQAMGESPASAALFSLSLSQEEEAKAVARRMLASGHETAISLSADTPWGLRMEQAFQTAFEAGGGSVLESARFQIRVSDHSDQLKRLLQIESSERRRDLLQQTLGLTLSFEPHVRNDFDALFLSAGPEQARQLRPQLRFFDAGDVPTFAMGRAFSGEIDPVQDQDLDGIYLPLTRAQVDASESGVVPAMESVRNGRSLNLYALGQDAWGVLRWLPLLQADPDLSYPGEVGSLSTSGSGFLQRDPVWAQFRSGRPRAVTWPSDS